MPIVVSDTSPVRALSHLGLVTALANQYSEVFVPPAVVAELLSPSPPIAIVDVQHLPFVRVQAPADRAKVHHFMQTLDAGESEALALALEIHAALTLIDEKKGRIAATQCGLTPVGTLGILVECKKVGLISAVKPLINRLKQDLNFFISSRLEAQVLQSVGE